MQGQPGLFITVEGVQGSGKATQCRLLQDRLEAAGYDVLVLSFPRYSQSSSYFVREYQRLAYGPPDQVGPYTAALFYALDRHQTATSIRDALTAGKIVIANRYVGSNMAYQGSKIPQAEERRGFFIWLDNLEFYMLGTPRPDMNFVLRLTADTATDTTSQPESVSTVYDDICQLFPKDFIRVDRVRGGKQLSAEDLSNILWGKVEPLLPERPAAPAKTHSVAQPMPQPIVKDAEQETHTDTVSPPNANKSSFHVPSPLEPSIRQKYIMTMDELRQLKQRMGEALAAHRLPASIVGATTPLATLTPAGMPLMAITDTASSSVRQLADASLPANHAAAANGARLTNYSPRNELELAPDMLYEFSDQPLADIQKVTNNWSYDQKAALVTAYVRQHTAALAKAWYSWDIVSDFITLGDIERLTGQPAQRQAASPRLGYDVPEAIEQAGLSDDYQRCFDLSLELHSQLRAAGYTAEAQYAVLAGHRLRWKITLSAADMLKLSQAQPLHDGTKRLVRTLREQQAEIHPLLTEQFTPVPEGIVIA